MQEIAKKGGLAKGKCKRRGDKAYYSEIGRKGAAVKKEKAEMARIIAKHTTTTQ